MAKSPPAVPAGGKIHENLILGGLVAVIIAVGITRAAAWCAFALDGRRMPHGRVLASLAAFGHWRDPSVAWGAPVGSVAVYWLLTGLLALAALGVVFLGWQIHRSAQTGSRRDRPHHKLEGVATRAHVVAHAGSKKLLDEAKHLRPSMTKPDPAQVGLRLGTSQGQDCWIGPRDSPVIVGPPGAGKGLNVVIPSILDWNGPVVTTSTRPDNLAVTMAVRAKRGPVAVFDPQRLAPGITSAARWSPTRGCQDPQTAMARAAGLVTDAARGTENGSFWAQQAIQAVQCLLHAAALAGRPTADLYRWSLSARSAQTAVGILRTYANDEWADTLASILGGEPRVRDSVWSVVMNTWSCLADPRVLAAVSPDPGEVFDPVEFLEKSGTVYLFGTAGEASSTARLVAAFIEDLVDVASRLAAVSANSRMDPPLALILDEAANYPIRSLPGLMSQGGGTGIMTMVVLQSLAQARDQWGTQRAAAIWDAATAKLILGGQANATDLADLSKLLGETEITDTSVSTRAAGETSHTTSTRYRPILSIEALRTLPEGQGVLLLRSAPPVILGLSPWTGRRNAKPLEQAKVDTEETMRAAAAARAAPLVAALPIWGPPATEIPVSESTGWSPPPGAPDGERAGVQPPASRPAPSGQLVLGLDVLTESVRDPTPIRALRKPGDAEKDDDQ